MFIVVFQETSSLLKRLGTLKDLENSRIVPDGNDLEEPVSVTGLETFSLSYKVSSEFLNRAFSFLLSFFFPSPFYFLLVSPSKCVCTCDINTKNLTEAVVPTFFPS